ncbi:MAG: cytochrome c-type biogenesis protein CcmH [Trueperaceae bacterium]|nr:MAG: cytochrome c-type biogenesis protein CcmH [Trueperaceae bacterium]
MNRFLLASLLSLAIGLAAAQELQLEKQVFEIGRQLRCPVCVSESVADSNAQISIEMRQLIQEQLEEGRNEREILAFFQERYGDWILLNPPKRGLHLVVWLLPVLVGLGGAFTLVVLVRRWLKSTATPLEVDETELERVRAELEHASEGPSKSL